MDVGAADKPPAWELNGFMSRWEKSFLTTSANLPPDLTAIKSPSFVSCVFVLNLDTAKLCEQVRLMKVLTPAMEDYLKVIYKLQKRSEVVTTQAIAEAMKIKAASVTNMLKKLARLKLVRYSAYKGVKLTPMGERMALEIIRHHRLLELYLREALKMPLHKVHEEAERLEHALSEDLEDLIALALGNPTYDPHGDPIPTKEGHFQETEHYHLAEVPQGQKFLIVRVSDSNPELLHYLEQLGLIPRAIVTVVNREPFGGPLWVQVDDQTHALGQEAAKHIFVQPVTSDVEAHKPTKKSKHGRRRPA